jgi:hypothetical protein
LEAATFNPTQSCERLRKSGKLCLSFSVVLFVLQNTEAPSPAPVAVREQLVAKHTPLRCRAAADNESGVNLTKD